MKVSQPTITIDFEDGSAHTLTLSEAAELVAQLTAMLPYRPGPGVTSITYSLPTVAPLPDPPTGAEPA